MEIQNILTPERTQYAAKSSTKKSMLELTSKMLAEENSSLHYNDILTKLVERERLGSTGIGHGVAIPHARIAGIDSAIASLIHLDTPINFDSADDQPVDLIFGFIVPEGLEGEHLELISTLATLFNEERFREKLRSSGTNAALYEQMVSYKKATSHE